ncbi:MAG: oligoendopeptidase F [Nitrospinota bacterium]|nr:MAG: oligoendopeptidase F [Nitrospinota bacterium]
MTHAVPARSEIPPEYTWDLRSVFPSDQAWEAEIQQVEAQLPLLSRFRGHLGDGPSTLADWFAQVEPVLRSLGKIRLYAHLLYSVDTADQSAAAKYDRARSFYARVMATIAFAEPEMTAIGVETLRRWTQEEPRLAIYSHYFSTLAHRQAHIRSAEVEELLNQLRDPFSTAGATHSILANADLSFKPALPSAEEGEPIPVAQSNIWTLLTHPDREVRRTAWENYADAHLTVKNTLANCLAAGVKQNVFLARARRYSSALEAALKENHLPVQVFYNVLETYRKHLPTWHRYWRLRRRVLDYDTLHVYDIKAPLTTHTPSVPFEQAVEWIAQGLQPLGEEYVQTLRRGALEQRWVDRYPNRGKRLGAFSTGTPGTHPFVLMSYADDLFSLSTLAHELGHSMHSYYTWQNQPLVYARYSLFVAEVASNFHQAMVRAHLLQSRQEREFQIAVLEEAMSNFHRYFFVMPILARFELEIHERVERGEPLTAERLIALMAELFAEGYGGEVAIDTERIGITWAQFPTHLYSNFYVFQYATGIAGAHVLAERVRTGGPEAAAAYLDFLKAGGSLYPLEALKLAGVDLSSPEPLEETFGLLAQMIDRLENLLIPRS